MSTQTCEQCGAPFPLTGGICPYCGTPFQLSEKQQLRQADFGIADVKWLFLVVIGAAVIYAYGWKLEDTQYLLSEGAIILWAFLLPLWLMVSAFMWRAFWGGWLPGFAFALLLFLFHCAIIYLIKGHLTDDGVGISAMFAGAALLGWFAGRGLHIFIRARRAKAGKGGESHT